MNSCSDSRGKRVVGQNVFPSIFYDVISDSQIRIFPPFHRSQSHYLGFSAHILRLENIPETFRALKLSQNRKGFNLLPFFFPFCSSGFYRFHEDMENMVQVLEAPLRGGKANMLLLLPFHVENLARLDKLLSLQLMSKWLEKINVTSVSISLPQANISSTLSLQVGL